MKTKVKQKQKQKQVLNNKIHIHIDNRTKGRKQTKQGKERTSKSQGVSYVQTAPQIIHVPTPYPQFNERQYLPISQIQEVYDQIKKGQTLGENPRPTSSLYEDPIKTKPITDIQTDKSKEFLQKVLKAREDHYKKILGSDDDDNEEEEKDYPFPIVSSSSNIVNPITTHKRDLTFEKQNIINELIVKYGMSPNELEDIKKNHSKLESLLRKKQKEERKKK